MNIPPAKRPLLPYALLFLVYVVFVVALAWSWIGHEEMQIYAEADLRLQQAASSLKLLLAPDFHDRATDSSAIARDEELRNRRQFNAFAQTNHLKYVYTLVVRDNAFYFSAPTVSDVEAAERESWYFYPYTEIPSAFRQAYARAENSTASYTDEWGSFRSVCVYELSPGGRPYLACADVEATALDSMYFQYALVSLAVAVALLLFIVPFAMIMARHHRKHMSEVQAACAATREHLVLIQNLMDQLPDGLVLLDVVGQATLVNRAFTDITGYGLHDIVSLADWFRRIYPDAEHRVAAERDWALARQGGALSGRVSRIRHRDGSFRHIELRGRFLPDGRSFRLLTDVSARTEIKERLRLNLELFQSLVEQLPVGLLLTETDNTVTLINAQFTRITGYSLEDVQTRNAWFRLAHPERSYRKMVLQTWAWLRRRGEGAEELRVTCKDGTERYCAFSGRLLSDGRSFVLLRDVTERRQSQEALLQSEAMLRLILDALDVGIVVIGRADLRVRYANMKMLAMTGYESVQLLGSHCKEYICANCSPECPVRDMNTEVDRMEQMLHMSDGRDLPVLKSVIETRMRDEAVFVEALVDISALKDAERELVRARDAAQAASMAKSEFLAVMSHELRTPMNGILGALQILRELDPEGMEDLIENALHSSRALLTLINDVLDLSSLESGGVTLQERSFGRSELVQPVLDALQESASGKGLCLECSIDPRLPDVLVGDLSRLRQVLFNLLGNAIKYTQNGQVGLEITILPCQTVAGQAQLHFQITDTGIGIADGALDTIFDPFTQSDMALNRRVGGMGVGLAIVRRLLRLMGGSLCVLSEEGQGSEFHFSLSLGNACAWDSGV